MAPWISETFDNLYIFAEADGETMPAARLEAIGRQDSKFVYGKRWQERKGHPIDPVHLPVRGRPYASTPFAIPLILFDACPDGWGKEILQAAFPLHLFRTVDFLAAAGSDRTGALQTGFDPKDGPRSWLPSDMAMLPLPPAGIQNLADLMSAAAALEDGRPDPGHLQWLLRGSGDVGGARPKARIAKDGHGWIAKFAAKGDPFDDPRVEAMSLDLAAACGIDVPAHELIEVMNKAVLLVKRFDRSATGERHDYMSAASLVGQGPGVYWSEYTYADVAIAARKAHFEPCEKEIFRRLLFYAFIHCTDDHLRNTAFIRTETWRLSPVFDVVPHRQERHATLVTRGASPHPDPRLLFQGFPSFKLERREALAIYDEIAAGMTRLPALLDAREVTSRDRRILCELMPHAFDPPAVDPAI